MTNPEIFMDDPSELRSIKKPREAWWKAHNIIAELDENSKQRAKLLMKLAKAIAHAQETERRYNKP